MTPENAVDYQALARMSRDLASSAKLMTQHEARLLVDRYYQMQDARIRTQGQVRAVVQKADSGEEQSQIFDYLLDNSEMLENQVKRALTKFAEGQALGQWAMSHMGIAGVLAAGLLAHIDFLRVDPLTKAFSLTSAGKIWKFAGIDGQTKWEKGQVRPFNAKLKTLCYKIGESFVKVQNNDKDFYGKLFAAKKKEIWAKNLAGQYQDAALEKSKMVSKDTGAYLWYSGAVSPDWARGILESEESFPEKPVKSSDGLMMLSPAHVHARARRWVVKLFLSHYFEVGYFLAHKKLPPAPYVFAHVGHTDYIPPPNFNFTLD